jgi:sulfur transfer protein SufE
MHFQDSDLHDAMKVSLETLLNIINHSNDTIVRGNAAISLANIIFDIYDRQKAEEVIQISPDDWVDEEDE